MADLEKYDPPQNLKTSMKYFHNTLPKIYVITFINLNKAYNSIDRESLFEILAQKTTKIIKKIPTVTKSNVKLVKN